MTHPFFLTSAVRKSVISVFALFAIGAGGLAHAEILSLKNAACGAGNGGGDGSASAAVLASTQTSVGSDVVQEARRLFPGLVFQQGTVQDLLMALTQAGGATGGVVQSNGAVAGSQPMARAPIAGAPGRAPGTTVRRSPAGQVNNDTVAAEPPPPPPPKPTDASGFSSFRY